MSNHDLAGVLLALSFVLAIGWIVLLAYQLSAPRCRRRSRRAVRLNGTLSSPIDRNEEFLKEGAPVMDLHDGKKVLYTPNPTDADGNTAPIEAGSLQGSSSDTSLVTVERNPDGSETLVVSTVPGPGLGTATVTFTADADLGDGVSAITETRDINVIAGDAAALAGTFGPEEDR